MAENYEFRENFNEVNDRNADKLEMFRNRLVKMLRHRGKLARKSGISCYRLYDHDIPEFPFSIEWYDADIYVAEYRRNHGMDEAEHENWLQDCLKVISETTDIPPDRIHAKTRQRKAGRQGQYQKLDQAGRELTVEESGLHFIVNLDDYLDTGLFLDHRITRQWVRKHAEGKRVLNLFAYTGSFSVYAASGNAALVETVDLSNTYLQWARRNMALNGFTDLEKFRFVQADVLAYLQSLPANAFDLIVMDPPTFSNSKRMEGFLDIQRDHVPLIRDACASLAEKGQLIFSTNYRRFILDREALSVFHCKDMTKATTPFDFEGKFSRLCYLIEKAG